MRDVRPSGSPPPGPPADSPLGQLRSAFPHAGALRWIGVRPSRRAPIDVLDRVTAEVGQGLVGDRFVPNPNGPGTRQVTLIQAEHLPVIGALLGGGPVDPARLRRNLVVEGINLTALKGRRVRIGGAVELELAGPCEPCSRMEDELGPGGFNAMRGHGGWNARVIGGGEIAIGDAVTFLG